MTNQISLNQDNLNNDPIKSLENEIAFLEKELLKNETSLNAFESQIRSQLQVQILRIRELTALYKKQKLDKKAKRLEQKKRGKNYKEPKGIQKTNSQKSEINSITSDDQLELKRLYKEAITHVHPDKFFNEEESTTERATALTIQLNAIYKSGNLDELSDFYEHIVSGNAMSHMPFQSESIKDSKAMTEFLKKKKDNLVNTLEKIKQSYTYNILTTYEDPLVFINELRLQFEQRIIQLEKRTRK